MKNTLRFKIAVGFVLLSAILLVAAAVIYVEAYKLEKSVKIMGDDNYKTIESARVMLEALEREDSGILLLLLGNQKEGREIIHKADSIFVLAVTQAQFNLSQSGEDAYLEKIKESYADFKELYEAPIVNTDKQGNINWYFDILAPGFVKVKTDVKNLSNFNEDSMHKGASELKERMHRSLMPGLVAIAVALVFSVLLNFFISLYFVHPVQKLADTVRIFKPGDKAFYANLVSSDEIKKLETEIRLLIERVGSFYRDQSK
ncbi:MAG: hypothetical protein RIS47_7 [Bacteroidota bacterium]|jgi:methyl-accepting chemotaxis protein